MLTITPSSGPSEMPAFARASAASAAARAASEINREAGARALAFRIGDAGERLFEPIAKRSCDHRQVDDVIGVSHAALQHRIVELHLEA